MLYDSNPAYPHYEHLPYAREPWKALYVSQRLFTTILLTPCWIVYYIVLPYSYRPRPSWSIKQIVNVKFTRRIYKITEVAGVTWGTRNPDEAPNQGTLMETRFEWAPPLPEDLRTGIVCDSVPFKRVGVYIWPKALPIKTLSQTISSSAESTHLKSTSSSPNSSPMLDGGPAAGGEHLIGIFMHGGGYCHMSAHENSRTSKIPRRLIKDGLLTEVYSVEYRLLQNAPFPAATQDAAAVYAHVVNHYAFKKLGSRCKIFLIGDSSGGNLVLSLARWIRDEGWLPAPDGLILLSPSCDIAHALPETLSSYIPRPNASTDYLVDTPEPRALLQRTFLGFLHRGRDQINRDDEKRLMEIVHSEYVSPASPRVLKRWNHPVLQDVDGQAVTNFQRHIMSRLDTFARDARAPDVVERGVDSSLPKTSNHASLFGDFPRTLVVVGDAERLVREIKSLVAAMERDGVDVRTHWAKDAVHDILIIGDVWWDKEVVGKVWKEISRWIKEF